MNYAIKILEQELKMLQDSVKKFQKTKRRKKKKHGSWMYNMISKWNKLDKKKIISIKKSIKILNKNK